MWLGLSNILDDCLLKYNTIRVLILTGHGQISFCSGADLSEKEDEDIDHTVPNIRIKLLQFPLPIIAKIHGYCLGGGLALAMNVDIRIASQNALFSIPAVKLGLPCPKDIIDRLIKLVGESHAKMILYTGDRISAQQAHSIGLIQYVCDNHDNLDQYVLDLARTLSCNAPLSVRSIKIMIENGNDDLAIKAAIDACRNSNDIIEGRNAFREKREAKFQGQKLEEQIKHDAQQKEAEWKHQAEQKGTEIKEKAGEATDAARDKFHEVKDAANKKANEMKLKADETINDAKQTGAQLADDASEKACEVKNAAQQKVNEIKPKVNEKIEQTKEAGAQLADDASKKAGEVKNTAETTTNIIIGTAIHAKDVTVEKVQEIGHTVVETVQNIPEVAANAASFVGEKLSVAGQWAAEKASEVGTATMQSAQEAIHSLTAFAGEATAKAEETTDKAKEKGAELNEQASLIVSSALSFISLAFLFAASFTS
ncbi:unnamed protein product [Rotaria sp. Silwood2]|nr:unnamed protein product [Rotaria sp. Silwood2]